MISMDDDEAQARDGADTPGVADAGSGGRNPAAASDGAELATATRGRTKAEVATQLMEQWSSAATCGGPTSECCATRAPRVPMA